MKIRDMMVKRVSVASMIVVLILVSCSKNNDVLNSTDVENINSESVSDSYTNETSDMSIAVLSNVNDTQLGSSGLISDLGYVDSRLTGAAITVSGTGGASNPQGNITVNFGTGTADPAGVIRKGLMTIMYSGRRWATGSSYTISYSGYSRNNVMFDDHMTLAITNLSPDSTATILNFHHLLTGGKLSFPDYTSILRNAEFNVAINLIAKTSTISASGLTHSATGTMRAGADFVMDITKPMVYKASCIASKVYLPVGGEKSITAGGATYKINYGDGSVCDNTVTVIDGGKSTTITVHSDGN